jgi:hypothetical protein
MQGVAAHRCAGSGVVGRCLEAQGLGACRSLASALAVLAVAAAVGVAAGAPEALPAMTPKGLLPAAAAATAAWPPILGTGRGAPCRARQVLLCSAAVAFS